MDTAETEPSALYDNIAPELRLGLPFVQTAVSEEWFGWPKLPELFPVSFSGARLTAIKFSPMSISTG